MKKLLTLLPVFILFSQILVAQVTNLCPQYYAFLNGKPILKSVYEFVPGDTMNLVLVSYDTPTDSIKVSSADVAIMLPGATFTTDNAKQQTAYITWIPSVADVTLAPRVFNVKFKDNSFCSVTFMFSARVNKPGSIELNNGLVNLNRDIELEPGTPMNLRFSSADPALADSIKIRSNVTSVLAGATFTTDFARRQTANINFTPTAAQVNPQPYSFTVTYQDNAPVPNQYIYTVNVKVRNAGVLGTAQNVVDGSNFSAFPNPFTDAVSFRIDKGNKAESILIYNLLGQQVDQILIPNSSVGQQQITWEKAGKFANGTYLARLTSEGKTLQTLRFIKQ